MKVLLAESEGKVSNDQRPCAVLIVSACLEHRGTLLRILEALNIEALVCATLAQARGALSKRTAAVSVCDDKLPDGTYSDFLELQDRERKTSRVIVTMMNDEWESYLEAIRLGAFDVLQFPFSPTDLELSLIHALREVENMNPYSDLEATQQQEIDSTYRNVFPQH